MLHDIALLTGGKTFTKGVEIQPKDIKISDLGHARKITVNKSQTSIHSLRAWKQTQTHASLNSSAGCVTGSCTGTRIESCSACAP